MERGQSVPEGHFRNPARRDRDRIRYTRYFRRLSGVTQVAHSEEAQLYHNRLTHSMKVAQVASALARIFLIRHDIEPEYATGRRLGQSNQPGSSSLATSLDPYVVEAAAHAHDLGHPPFGHCGEKTLDDLVEEASDRPAGFEGNAQSFRIVTSLAARNPDWGCNVTRATLKYPWDRNDPAAEDDDGEPDKWGYYTDPGTNDASAFHWARRPLEGRTGQKVLEAQIMDWADDVTYAVHDLQDFFRSGLIPLDELLREAIGDAGSPDPRLEQFGLATNEELGPFRDYLEEKTDVDTSTFDVAGFFTDILQIFDGSPASLLTPFENTDAERRDLKRFTSMLVSRYLEAKRSQNPKYVKLSQNGPHWDLLIDPAFENEVETLKALTEFYVISNPVLMQQQEGQEEILRNVFRKLLEEAKDARAKDFPAAAIPSPYLERVRSSSTTDTPLYRIVADLIASLTEQQVISLHERLHGWTPGTIQQNLIG
ncbi:deoxyguanosinetriphosphate triphosphohydrolase family protein [Halorhabdus rudnickae]|uniref:deoxyguanosinetriphosphate triphosphohydrolase family protein n=1 Tax=Halorhabdus rudnickae TaxID=1775544 RepID=UPI001FCE7DF7|nr:dNTP triphosphohydrolase [Halorhabdus rudnickae]